MTAFREDDKNGMEVVRALAIIVLSGALFWISFELFERGARRKKKLNGRFDMERMKSRRALSTLKKMYPESDLHYAERKTHFPERSQCVVGIRDEGGCLRGGVGRTYNEALRDLSIQTDMTPKKKHIPDD